MKNEKEMMNFCENIRALRKMHHLSEAEMAKRMGIGVKTLSRIENNDPPEHLSGSVLLHLCREFRTTAAALIFDYKKLFENENSA